MAALPIFFGLVLFTNGLAKLLSFRDIDIGRYSSWPTGHRGGCAERRHAGAGQPVPTLEPPEEWQRFEDGEPVPNRVAAVALGRRGG